ncbi:MAG: beta-aspartyl-peptidase [Firmicutes bacterium]|nr:beta-aspartyl-peptidase [Alicyclobacillaceae bacterium]MCL6496384.1 beta-aspartyl-peptidase [Bacillota bacterium]
MSVPSLLVQGAEVFGPEPLGRVDVLAVGDRVVAIGSGLSLPSWSEGQVQDGRGLCLVPGLVDLHVHFAGGGGEGGPRYRTPELALSALTRAGITAAVGVLGTDGTTRSVAELLAKARALADEGLHTWIYTGAYSTSTRTLTGSLRDDVILIDRVIGVGEIALSDFRGSHPSEDELARLAGEAHVGGLLGGKAGVLHLHVGDGPEGLKPLVRLVERADVPLAALLPTHLNRRRALLIQAAAWGRQGGAVDLTTGIAPSPDDADAVSAAAAADWLRRQGVPLHHITFSSDAGGSAPQFDADGRMVGMGVGRPDTLWRAVWELRATFGWPWPEALAPATANPARRLALNGVGRIGVGAFADWLLVDPDHGRIASVVAQGRVVVDGGEPVVWGTFERQRGRE